MRTARKTERCSALYGSKSTAQMRLVESRIEQIASHSVDFGFKSSRRSGSEQSQATGESGAPTGGDQEKDAAAPNAPAAGRKRRESVFQRGLRKSISIVRGDGWRSRRSSQAAATGIVISLSEHNVSSEQQNEKANPNIGPESGGTTVDNPNALNSDGKSAFFLNVCTESPSSASCGLASPCASTAAALATTPVSPHTQRGSGSVPGVGRHNGPSLFDVAHTLAIQREFAEEILQKKVALEKRKRQNREVTRLTIFPRVCICLLVSFPFNLRGVC